ncbi:response regulator [Pseudomonas marginalis]|uniref:Response regulator n=1 Tax=Pseudomonas petroselini TaxID=2899822 RepID=A0ABS8QQD1_9PSED|nr:response regulator [Pseudomonas marginalis]MCD7037867.1 response regulator [Pseudomonas petroselini]MCD7047136.1 response regulator [Pseudomonas petroselini]MCD7067861.1 response regulator [Pseudomonas petroselini]MCD7079616.1 response regulator [Pseudomonas petroselini]MCF5664683.1 response regulator [Pseudomonas marginalis]
MNLDLRILIIDDQRPNLELVEQLLAREGLTNVLSSTEPLRALELFNSFEPDLVILDLHMPELDGFAVLEQLNRRIPNGEYLPILVLTADATRDTRLRALALGARDFISKPLDALETMLRVWNLLETRVLYKTLRTRVPADQIELLQRRGTMTAPSTLEGGPGSPAIRRC